MDPTQKPSVLIVEDNPTGIASLVGILSGACELVIAKSLSSARKLLSADIDLILLDLYLPDGTGLEFLSELKKSDAYRNLPVVCITGSEDTNDIETAFREGAIDYVLKPFNKTILSAKVSTFIDFKRKSEVLASQSFTDPLTGIGNRRLFDQQLDLEWRRAHRSGNWLGLALIDLDHFKAINDRYGHTQGDACLRRLADAMKKTFSRAGDVVARLGGDEFVALLPGTATENVVQASQRLDGALAQERQSCQKAEQTCPTFTTSIGCYSLRPNENESASALIGGADKYLYEAKEEGGRACVRPEVKSPRQGQ